MVKRLVGSICYERFPRGMGGDFSPVPSAMAEGLMLGSARFVLIRCERAIWVTISPGVNKSE